VSTSNCRAILARARLVVRLIVERSRDRQSDCRDDREQHKARRCSETSGPEHVQDAGMTNFRLVQERIAFDDNKCDSRRPEAEADEPCAHATRWGASTHGATWLNSRLLEAEHTRAGIVHTKG
jgi:hypothetical protein